MDRRGFLKHTASIAGTIAVLSKPGVAEMPANDRAALLEADAFAKKHGCLAGYPTFVVRNSNVTGIERKVTLILGFTKHVVYQEVFDVELAPFNSADIGGLFRGLHDYGDRHDYLGGWPNGKSFIKRRWLVHTAYLLTTEAGSRRSFPLKTLSDLAEKQLDGNASLNDRSRALQKMAEVLLEDDVVAAIPDFHQTGPTADTTELSAYLIKPGVVKYLWRPIG